MAQPVLVKLGGSVLTDKSREPSLRRAALHRLVREVASAGEPTVLLHGAGSFGHGAALRHGIGKRPATTAAARAGVSAVLAGVGLLHAHVVAAAADAGLRPVSVPLHDRAPGKGGFRLPIAQVRHLLSEGHTPILPGTLVRHPRLAWRILSADEALSHLAAALRPRLALFVTDVDGVFDRDPEAPGARRLERTGPAARAGAARGADATGGMAGKLRHARAAARSAPTLIVNGNVRGRVAAALAGRATVGTWVDPS